MTAKMTRNILLMLVATVLMGIVLNLYIHNTGTVPAADNAAPLTDGSYTSSAQGCLSEVTVTVTVTGGKVTSVQVDASAETPDLGGKAAETLDNIVDIFAHNLKRYAAGQPLDNQMDRRTQYASGARLQSTL